MIESPGMWKPFSECVDDFVLGARAIFSPRALRGGGDAAPPGLDELVAEQEARPPEVRWPARLDRRVGRISLRMPVIDFDTFADFHPARDAAADTLFVYHHGLSEFPHDGSAGKILGRGRLAERVDWFAIRGPHHDSRAAVDDRLLLSQESFAKGLLSSVFTARALAAPLRARYKHVVIGGMSMGGVIALIESAIGSAFDLCVPLMAGPDLESVLLRSSFSRVVCPQYRERAAHARFATRLDLVERLARRDGPPIRAVLSSYDRLFRIEAQRAAYAPVARAAVTEISGGHLTGALQFRKLAALIEAALERECWSRGPGARRAAPPLASVA